MLTLFTVPCDTNMVISLTYGTKSHSQLTLVIGCLECFFLQWVFLPNSGSNSIHVFFLHSSDQDGAEPSGNSVSAMNLLRLASFLNRPEWLHQAVDLLKLFSERLNKIPMAVPEMVSALLFYHESPKQVSTTILQGTVIVRISAQCGSRLGRRLEAEKARENWCKFLDCC